MSTTEKQVTSAPDDYRRRLDAYERRCQLAIDGMSEGSKNALLLALLMKRRSDGLNGRAWDSHEHLQWERIVVREANRVEPQIS